MSTKQLHLKSIHLQILAHPGLRPANLEVPTGVHELEEEVEDDALNEVDDDVPHPVTK